MDEYEKIKFNPNKYISDLMGEILINVGKKVFKLLALQPCSLLLPDMNASNPTRATFNILYISEPSTGKSTVCDVYSSIIKNEDNTFNPYIIRGATGNQLRQDLSKIKPFSLIVEDFSEIGDDYEALKVLEGALGDEKNINKKTMSYVIEARTQGVGLLCGTWEDLGKYHNYLKSGLFYRLVFLFVNLTPKEIEEIGKYINDNMGNHTLSDEIFEKRQIVREYYRELSTIMAGEHEKIPQINGYFFEKEIKDKIYDSYCNEINYEQKIIKEKFNKILNFSRELQEGYRFLISNAFLNVFNRKIINGILHPNNDDCELAIELMLENLNNKIDIIKSSYYLNTITNAYDLQNAMRSKIPDKVKKILMNLSRLKK